MIQVTDKKKCCGCSACVSVCPKHCISMLEDSQGFKYPVVHKEQCINCRLCEKVCPYINQNESRKPLRVFAAINPQEEIRKNSSSGGIFYLIAQWVISEGGVVFGAQFNNNWEVIHNYTDNKDDLSLFQGSKYVQSSIGESYTMVRFFLKNGRKVLFSGTPCQIDGLLRYLYRPYDNLFTMEIICHGVPSPLLWRMYINKFFDIDDIKGISFRDKRNGWKSYGLRFDKSTNSFFEPACKNTYMQAYLNHFNLRPSCTNCVSKAGRSRADLQIGDYWGFSGYPNFMDNKGVSAIITYTSKGLALVEATCHHRIETKYEDVLQHNPSVVVSTQEHRYYDLFWDKVKEKGYDGALHIINKLKPSFVKRVVSFFKRKLPIRNGRNIK